MSRDAAQCRGTGDEGSTILLRCCRAIISSGDARRPMANLAGCRWPRHWHPQTAGAIRCSPPMPCSQWNPNHSATGNVAGQRS